MGIDDSHWENMHGLIAVVRWTVIVFGQECGQKAGGRVGLVVQVC